MFMTSSCEGEWESERVLQVPLLFPTLILLYNITYVTNVKRGNIRSTLSILVERHIYLLVHRVTQKTAGHSAGD